MTTSTRNIALLAILGLIVAIGSLVVVRLIQPETCGGIDRSLGGCDSTYAFTGTDCAAVAKEFGSQLDATVQAILNGPEAVAEESRGVRITHALTVGTTRANQYIKAASIPCQGASFVDAALAQISPAVKGGVGAALYVGGSETYDEWAAEIRKVVTPIIDAPAAS